MNKAGKKKKKGVRRASKKKIKQLGLCSCSKRKAGRGHCKTALMKATEWNGAD